VSPSLPQSLPGVRGWLHENKHDGYRLIAWREGDRVRLFTRRGYDWTDRFPAIAAAALRLNAQSFTIDGEAVVAGRDGIAGFDKIHGHRRHKDAFLWAFDLLTLNGDDLRTLTFVKRKATLARLLARSCGGIVCNDHTEGDGLGCVCGSVSDGP
jgi:bifunctional non-homologous end joining protein LigD